MKNNFRKILALIIFCLGSLSLAVPNFVFASDDGWTDLSWNHSRRREDKTWHLEKWWKEVRQNWTHQNDEHKNNRDDNDRGNREVFISGSQSSNVYVRQSQEVVGHYKSVEMEQSVRIYTNGQLTTSAQQSSSDNWGDGIKQTQEVSVRN